MSDMETPEFRGRGGEGRGPGGERGERGERKEKGGGKGGFFRRRKTCKLCSEKVDYVDYKNTKLLLAFIPERAKILPGGCSEPARPASARSAPPSCGRARWRSSRIRPSSRSKIAPTRDVPLPGNRT